MELLGRNRYTKIAGSPKALTTNTRKPRVEVGARRGTEVMAKLVHSVRTACSANTMKPSQGGREETPMHLCRRHKGLHILGGWWPWPSAICCCVGVLEDGDSLLGT